MVSSLFNEMLKNFILLTLCLKVMLIFQTRGEIRSPDIWLFQPNLARYNKTEELFLPTKDILDFWKLSLALKKERANLITRPKLTFAYYLI